MNPFPFIYSNFVLSLFPGDGIQESPLQIQEKINSLNNFGAYLRFLKYQLRTLDIPENLTLDELKLFIYLRFQVIQGIFSFCTHFCEFLSNSFLAKTNGPFFIREVGRKPFQTFLGKLKSVAKIVERAEQLIQSNYSDENRNPLPISVLRKIAEELHSSQFEIIDGIQVFTFCQVVWSRALSGSFVTNGTFEVVQKGENGISEKIISRSVPSVALNRFELYEICHLARFYHRCALEPGFIFPGYPLQNPTIKPFSSVCVLIPFSEAKHKIFSAAAAADLISMQTQPALDQRPRASSRKPVSGGSLPLVTALVGSAAQRRPVPLGGPVQPKSVAESGPSQPTKVSLAVQVTPNMAGAETQTSVSIAVQASESRAMVLVDPRANAALIGGLSNRLPDAFNAGAFIFGAFMTVLHFLGNTNLTRMQQEQTARRDEPASVPRVKRTQGDSPEDHDSAILPGNIGNNDGANPGDNSGGQEADE